MSNQIAEMFKESNSRMKKIMKGDFDAEKISIAQREFEGQIKLINSVVSAYGIMSKNNRAQVGLSRMNILDDTVAIDLCLGDPELDRIKCPAKLNKTISLSECLDFSGDSKNLEDCKDCEGFKRSRELVGPPLHTA